MKLCARDPVCVTRMVDTLVLARSRHPGAKHSLDALCTRFGVDRSQRVKHGALLDAQLLAQVYVELTGGRQIGLGLAAKAGDDAQSGSAVMPPIDRPLRPPRPHSAREAELQRHREFVAADGQSLVGSLRGHDLRDRPIAHHCVTGQAKGTKT